MRNRNKSQILVCVLLLTVAVLMLGANLVGASMCQFIRIEDEQGGGGTRLSLLPEKITVPVGTCTVWINWVTRGDINVSFRENAKQCMASTESQTGFNLLDIKDGESCYIADKLSKGKTASLYWKTPGIFKYTIEMTDSAVGSQSIYLGKPMATGIIEVK